MVLQLHLLRKFKKNIIDNFFGVLCCGTNGLSDQWEFLGVFMLSDQWVVGLMGCRTIGLSDQWADPRYHY